MGLNFKAARKRADDKILTKNMLIKTKISHPELITKFGRLKRVRKYDWMALEGGFVIKPAKGLGGNGVLVVRRKMKDVPDRWVLTTGKQVGQEDLILHTLDIIEGRYSRNGLADTAMVEERVKIHPKFRKLSAGGTPDVRVIVYNKIPVMAMLRLPTLESGGKANLHQGAIGLGIDMATGITTYGVHKDQILTRFPHSDKKVNGMVIPNWGVILRMAVETAMASKLNYLSIDFLLDEEKGPLVLELNDQPGLSIQLANRAGLRKRLERVEGLEVESVEQAVNIGRTLFASQFARRVSEAMEEKRIIGVFEKVKLKVGKKKKIEVDAKIDSGAYSTSIDEGLAKELGLLQNDNVLWKKKFKNALGEQERPVIKLVFWLKGKKVVTRAGIANRHGLRRKLIIGRRDLKQFYIEASDVRG